MNRVSSIAIALPVGLALVAAGCGRKAEDQDVAEDRVPVVLRDVTERTFVDSLVVRGELRAKNLAIVSARIPGIVEHLYVDAGAHVTVGETKLFKTDSIKLEKALAIARKNEDMARLSLNEAKANLERVTAVFETADKTYLRIKALFEQGAVTQQTLDETEAGYKQALAGLKHARTLIELATERGRQASLGVTISEKDLQDTLIVAPISGTVSERMREPGEMSMPGQPVIRIDDTSTIEVTASLPARHYTSVIPGKTKMQVSVGGVDGGEHAVIYRSPRIKPRLRTFDVKCVIEKPRDGFVPGALAEVRVVFATRTALAAPTESVLRRAGRKLLYTVAEGRARAIEVETGLVAGEWTEIVDTSLAKGAAVVSMGQSLLDDGTLVDVRNGGR